MHNFLQRQNFEAWLFSQKFFKETFQQILYQICHIIFWHQSTCCDISLALHRDFLDSQLATFDLFEQKKFHVD